MCVCNGSMYSLFVMIASHPQRNRRFPLSKLKALYSCFKLLADIQDPCDNDVKNLIIKFMYNASALDVSVIFGKPSHNLSV